MAPRGRPAERVDQSRLAEAVTDREVVVGSARLEHRPKEGNRVAQGLVGRLPPDVAPGERAQLQVVQLLRLTASSWPSCEGGSPV